MARIPENPDFIAKAVRRQINNGTLSLFKYSDEKTK